MNIGTEIPAAPSKLVIPRSYRRIIHFDCPWADAVFVLFFLLSFCFMSLSNRDCFHIKYAIWLQLLTEKRTKAEAKRNATTFVLLEFDKKEKTHIWNSPYVIIMP